MLGASIGEHGMYALSIVQDGKEEVLEGGYTSPEDAIQDNLAILWDNGHSNTLVVVLRDEMGTVIGTGIIISDEYLRVSYRYRIVKYHRKQ